MAEQFYVECDMQGNFLISADKHPLFLILYSDEDKKQFIWKSSTVYKEPYYYYLSDKIYKPNGEISLLIHDYGYSKIIKQVCTNTYQGTITLACEDLTKETI